MARRAWCAVGVALALGMASGCGLFCDRYCERERDRCNQINRGGCCAPAPAAGCAPACGPAPGSTYYSGQPACGP